VLIPNISDYRRYNVSNLIWWSVDEMNAMKFEAYEELRKTMATLDVDSRLASKILFQPEESPENQNFNY
jgi:hypothetical protein